MSYIIEINLNDSSGPWMYGPYEEADQARDGVKAIYAEMAKRNYKVESYIIHPLHSDPEDPWS